MIWAIDMDNRFTFVNDAVKQIHGYEPEEMIGRPFTDFQSPEIAAPRPRDGGEGPRRRDLRPVRDRASAQGRHPGDC